MKLKKIFNKCGFISFLENIAVFHKNKLREKTAKWQRNGYSDTEEPPETEAEVFRSKKS